MTAPVPGHGVGALARAEDECAAQIYRSDVFASHPVEDQQAVLRVLAERRHQDRKWGPDQTMPHGTGDALWGMLRDAAQEYNADPDEPITWLDILLEEVYEAASERDKHKLHGELVQAAAVALAWLAQGEF